MPLLKIRTLSIVLLAAIVVLLVPIGLTVRDIARAGDVVSWLCLTSLIVAIIAISFAARRQQAVRALIAERQRLEDERHASDAMFAGILSIAADAVITVDEHHRII